VRSLKNRTLWLGWMVGLLMAGLSCAGGTTSTVTVSTRIPTVETVTRFQPAITLTETAPNPSPVQPEPAISKTPDSGPASLNFKPLPLVSTATPENKLLTDTSPSGEIFPVVRVIDGDTIEVSIRGVTQAVRYIGIDSPEKAGPYTTEEPFSQAATDKNKELVEGRRVRLEKDVSEKDKYERLLRYVYVADLSVNAELVKLGLARAFAYPPDVKHQAEYSQLESAARADRRGLWGLAINSSPAALSLEIVSVSSPVKAGEEAVLKAHTLPGARCQIDVYYPSGASSAKGLVTRTADKYGSVAWTWTVSQKTTPGNWKIVVQAALNGQTVTRTTFFSVQ
jgi:endonuclease YncB( thermonuclease family)